MKQRTRILLLLILFEAIITACATAGGLKTQPSISNCDISPNEISSQTKVTISFDYKNVEGGLKQAKVLLTQEFQIDPQQKVVTRKSNWQAYLEDLSAYDSESGRFVTTFVNPERWQGPQIELTYKFKIVDKNGKESNICTTKIKPK